MDRCRQCYLTDNKYIFAFKLLMSFPRVTGTGSTNQSEILIDLVGLDIQSPSPPEQQPPPSSLPFPADLLSGSAAVDPPPPRPSASSVALSLLDEELLSLGSVVDCYIRTSCLCVDITRFDTFVLIYRPQWTCFCSSYISCNNTCRAEQSAVIITGI